jgi:hypothetical protein
MSNNLTFCPCGLSRENKVLTPELNSGTAFLFAESEIHNRRLCEIMQSICCAMNHWRLLILIKCTVGGNHVQPTLHICWSQEVKMYLPQRNICPDLSSGLCFQVSGKKVTLVSDHMIYTIMIFAARFSRFSISIFLSSIFFRIQR